MKMYFVCNPKENNMIIRGKTSCHFPQIKIKERIWWWVNVSTNPLGRELVKADYSCCCLLLSDWCLVRALTLAWRVLIIIFHPSKRVWRLIYNRYESHPLLNPIIVIKPSHVHQKHHVLKLCLIHKQIQVLLHCLN